MRRQFLEPERERAHDLVVAKKGMRLVIPGTTWGRTLSKVVLDEAGDCGFYFLARSGVTGVPMRHALDGNLRRVDRRIEKLLECCDDLTPSQREAFALLWPSWDGGFEALLASARSFGSDEGATP